jgi:error-prone DNA polymerase
MNLDRQGALWAIQPLRDERLPLFEQDDTLETHGADALPHLSLQNEVLRDYLNTGLSLKAHPISFIRDQLDKRNAIPASDLRSERNAPTGLRCSVAGVVLVRQRPSTASGVVFITLEDETGVANLIIWPKIFEQFRRVARLSAVLLAHGKIEREGEVVHLHVDSLESLDDNLESLTSQSRDFH